MRARLTKYYAYLKNRPYRYEVHLFCIGPIMQVSVAVLIMANFAVCIVFYQIRPKEGEPLMDAYDKAEIVFSILFSIELLITMYGLGLIRFFKSAWHMYDFIVIVISLVSMRYESLSGFSVLRVFRAFRAIRFFKRVKSLKRIIEGVINSLTGLVNACLIMFIFMSIWSVIGVEFFRDVAPEKFGSYARAMLTMWQMVTFDSWASQIARAIVFEKDMPYASIFFISYLYCVGIIIFNVVATSLLDKYLQTTKYGVSIIEQAVKCLKKEELIELIDGAIMTDDFLEIPTDELACLAVYLWDHEATKESVINMVTDPFNRFEDVPPKTTRSALLELLMAEQNREARRLRMDAKEDLTRIRMRFQLKRTMRLKDLFEFSSDDEDSDGTSNDKENGRSERASNSSHSFPIHKLNETTTYKLTTSFGNKVPIEK